MLQRHNDITAYEMTVLSTTSNQAYSQYKHSLTFRVGHHVGMATKPVHRSQIRVQQCTTRRHPYPSPNLHPCPCSSVGMWRGTDRQTDTDGRVANIYISSRLRLTRNVITLWIHNVSKCNIILFCNYMTSTDPKQGPFIPMG